MENRIEWIDTAKVITMILVIVGHCTYYNISTKYGGIHYFCSDCESSFAYSLTCHITSFIYLFHMPFFMFLSGACFGFGRKEETLASIVKKKALRLLLPFFAVTFLIAVPLKYLAGYWNGSTGIIRDVIYGQILFPNYVHLWFVLSLFWIFCISFFIKEWVKQPSITVILILLIVSVGGGKLSNTYDLLAIPHSLWMLVYFVLGYWYTEKIAAKAKRLSNTSLWLIAVLLFVIPYVLHSPVHSSPILYKLIYPFVFRALGLLGIYMMIGVSIKLCQRTMKMKCWNYLQRNAYTMYLFSDSFNYILIPVFFLIFGYGYQTDDMVGILCYILRITLTMLSAMALIFIWNKLKPYIYKI